MIKDSLQPQIADSLKKGDEIRVSTLRMLSTALLNAEIAKNRVPLTPDEEIKVVKSEAKKRSEAIEIYEHAGETARADQEKKELAILGEFLPEEIGDNEIEKVVSEVISQTNTTSISDMGKVMSQVMARLEGRADGSRVSQIVKSKLS